MLLFKQIIGVFVVYLDELHEHSRLIRIVLIDLVENVGKRPWNEASLGPLFTAADGESLATAGLSVGEYGCVESV